jgi:hypothetical protein
MSFFTSGSSNLNNKHDIDDVFLRGSNIGHQYYRVYDIFKQNRNTLKIIDIGTRISIWGGGEWSMWLVQRGDQDSDACLRVSTFPIFVISGVLRFCLQKR